MIELQWILLENHQKKQKNRHTFFQCVYNTFSKHQNGSDEWLEDDWCFQRVAVLESVQVPDDSLQKFCISVALRTKYKKYKYVQLYSHRRPNNLNNMFITGGLQSNWVRILKSNYVQFSTEALDPISNQFWCCNKKKNVFHWSK